MFNQMKQLRDMQKKANDLQKQLQAIKHEKTNSSGTLAVIVNGAQKVESLRIEPSWFSADKKQALETALTSLINDAFGEIQKETAMKAASMMKDLKGLGIPGL